MRGLTYAICGLTLLWQAAALAAECPGNPDAIGTSRTIVVDPNEHPRIGTMQYAESLPLEDHEIVLTFDDGPLPPYSNQVLEILASQCVKATYFLVGRMARTYPEIVEKIRAAGHTIGTHSENHPLRFQKMSVDQAAGEIEQGISSVTAALGGEAPAPFFRIPGLLRADGVERYLASQHLMVWSADFPADDWLRISPAQVYERALERIEANHRGILLLHDIHERTVEALPMLLRELKERGYHIVQVVPATPDQPKTATLRREWTRHVRKIWPQVPIYPEVEPELPAPSPASFGFGEVPVSLPPVQLPPRRLHFAARGEIRLPPVSPWPPQPDELPQLDPAAAIPHLPIPGRQSFSYPEDAPTPWLTSKTFDVVPEVNHATGTIPRLLMARRDPATPAAGPVPTVPTPPALRGPIATMTLPHGAFP
jgi:peptidoglycan-N-acetylglucosamine deacetylase